MSNNRLQFSLGSLLAAMTWFCTAAWALSGYMRSGHGGDELVGLNLLMTSIASTGTGIATIFGKSLHVVVMVSIFSMCLAFLLVAVMLPQI